MRPGAATSPAYRLLFATAVAVNLAVLYWPRPVSEGPDIPHLDKVAHLLVFAAVAWTGARAGLLARWLVPALVLHAVTSELAQAYLLPRRSGDAADVLADCAGVLAGMVLARASWRHERAAPSVPGD